MRYRATTASLLLGLVASIPASAVQAQPADQVKTASGVVQGVASADGKVRIFEGIPYAAPPVGDLRWRAPQPVASWTGVRKATSFGSHCMQGGGDKSFRDPGQSEDCLYLNVWTPARSAGARLPVMVWIYGGGFQSGSGSEPRQDGTALAHKGVIVVSMNYRLGIFGFMAHPELTRESPNHASGNYGLLDQVAALRWVHDNIAMFGGDPAKVTIFGESAGSISVGAQMATPLSRGLFQQAIGESGGIVNWGGSPEWGYSIMSLAQAESAGVAFGKAVSVPSLAALRSMSAAEIIEGRRQTGGLQFWPNLDGYFFPQDPIAIFAAGKQAHVPLLAGWNADEHRSDQFFGKLKPTKENYAATVRKEFGPYAPKVMKLFPGNTPQQIETSAHDLATDTFIAHSTWKWLNMHVATGQAPVYRFHFEQPQPEADPAKVQGIHHASEIEFVFGTLDSRDLPWTADHRRMSDIMSTYWTNFAKTGNPNGAGLPAWPRYQPQTNYSYMHLQVGPSIAPHAGPTTDRDQFELLDTINADRRNANKVVAR